LKLKGYNLGYNIVTFNPVHFNLIPTSQGVWPAMRGGTTL